MISPEASLTSLVTANLLLVSDTNIKVSSSEPQYRVSIPSVMVSQIFSGNASLTGSSFTLSIKFDFKKGYQIILFMNTKLLRRSKMKIFVSQCSYSTGGCMCISGQIGHETVVKNISERIIKYKV